MELRKITRDAAAMRAGEWHPLGPEFGGVEVNVSAMGGAYTDHLGNLRRVLARQYGGPDLIPAEEEGKAITEAVIAKVLNGVRAKPDDTIDGAPVTMENFTALMREPGAVVVVNAVMAASSRVGYQRENTVKAAVGNSNPPSATS